MGWYKMRRPITGAPREDSTFHMKFNSSFSEPIKLKLNKLSSVIDIKTDTNAPSEDTYYDEIIYYDGGGVNGYGN